MEKENVLLKAENKQLKAQMEGDKKKIASLEHRLVSAESANKSLSNKVAAYADMKQVLENDLDEKELALNAEQREKLKTKQKYKAKIVQERDKVASELVGKFNEREKALAQKHGRQVAKLNALKNLINDDLTTDTDDNQDAVNRKTTSDPNLSARASRRLSTSPRRSVAVSNNRHRRSRSTDVERWLDHRPVIGGPVPSNTILQPVLKKRRSVSKLETADLDTPSKY